MCLIHPCQQTNYMLFAKSASVSVALQILDLLCLNEWSALKTPVGQFLSKIVNKYLLSARFKVG